MIRGSTCGSFPPREVGWGGIWDQCLEKMLVKKRCFFLEMFSGRNGLAVGVLGAKLAPHLPQWHSLV